MSGIAAPPRPAASSPSGPVTRDTGRDRRGSWIPTWSMVTTKFLELRRRRGLMFVVFLLTLGLPFIVLGLRLFFHAIDPHSYGPAGTPSVFQGLSNPIAEFGFIIAAVVGATVGTTDLNEGVFRHLVVTGRSRLALYFARIPAALAMLFVLVALGYSSLCLVTGYAGTPQPATLNSNGISVPLFLSQPQLETWLIDHSGVAAQAGLGPIGDGGGKGGGPVQIGPNGPAFPQLTPAQVRQQIQGNMAAIYSNYTSAEVGTLNPPANEMVKIGLWIELEVLVGFIVGLGFGSLTGQRTLATVVMIVLEIILTPILAGVIIPYFINGQRLVVGVALDQMRPEWLASFSNGGGDHGGRVILGGRGLGIPPMPTWAMIAVIAGWIVAWTVAGAWKMARRDA